MSVPILRVCPQLPAVIAFGNPLLDIIVKVKESSILFKHGLEIDGQMEMSPEKIQQILQDLPQELMSVLTERHLVFASLIFYKTRV